MTEKVIIIGGGHAGGQLAGNLRQFGYQGAVELISAEPYPPYQRPPLSKQVLSDGLAGERCFLKSESFYADRGIQLSLGQSVVEVDPGKRRVMLESGESRRYDRLVFATGSRLRRLELPGTDLEGVFYLRDLDHALALRETLMPGKRIVVIGAGYIGLEVAASAVKLGCDVTVVELADRVMTRVSPAPVSRYLQGVHQANGVRFRMGEATSRFHGGPGVRAVELSGGSCIEADAVVVGIGVVPATDLAISAGLEIKGGIRVDAHCRTSDEAIYAVGDVTEFFNPILQQMLHLESVQNAVGQARSVAHNLCGQATRYEEVPWFWSEQYDLRVQMAGLPDEHQDLVIRGRVEDGKFSVLGVSDGRVLSVQSVNRPKDYMAGRKLIAARAKVPADALADPQSDLGDYL